ncbi:DUF4097 family beta strand repeat-containing protein [Streptomyces sp. CAU 1734]|uniref:DUF4097 family beta strand repeat-containing protein n=1 Tax=Streptomyces sp. CAU 1734 TaxID=3140360 RepID=UPI003260B68F
MTSPATVIRSRPLRALAVLSGGGILVAALAGCGDTNVDEAPVERKSFALSGKTLVIDSDDSDLSVVQADVADVRVSRQVDGWVFGGSGPEKVWKLKGDTLTLRMKCSAIASDCRGRHTVKVPLGTAVSVRSDNGGVTAEGLSGSVRVASDNGDVTVRDTTGPLELRTTNGKVSTENVAAERLSAVSDNGNVHIGVSAGKVPDRISAVSDNGEVRITLPRAEGPYAVTARSGNGSADVDVPTDRESSRVVEARSDNGNVRVRAAE